MAAILDPEVVKKRNQQLQDQIVALEQQFGYREHPEKDPHFHKKQDVLKMGKESYGVTLSLEYKRALLGQANNGSGNHFNQSSRRKPPGSKFEPTNAFEKITRTCDFKLTKKTHAAAT